MRANISSLIENNLKTKNVNVVKAQPHTDRFVPIEVNQLNNLEERKKETGFTPTLTPKEVKTAKTAVAFEIKELQNIINITEAKMSRVELFDYVPELREQVANLKDTLEEAKKLLIDDDKSNLITGTKDYSSKRERKKESVYVKYI